jgi:predicted RNase H-like nuclease (RuvC/YqgF family)
MGTQTVENSENATRQLADTALRMQQLMTSHRRMRDRLAARTEANSTLTHKVTELTDTIQALERDLKAKDVAVKAARKQLYQERHKAKRAARVSPAVTPSVMHPAEMSKHRYLHALAFPHHVILTPQWLSRSHTT